MKIEFHSNSDIDGLSNINVAKALIEHESTYHNRILDRVQTSSTFEVEDLEEIANHLLVYCKYEKIRNGETEE